MARAAALPDDLKKLIASIAEEPTARRRRQLLLAEERLWRTEAVAYLYDEVVRLLHVDLQQAERMARAAVIVAERLDDDASRAAGQRALAHVS
jgi:hypothetical protein